MEGGNATQPTTLAEGESPQQPEGLQQHSVLANDEEKDTSILESECQPSIIAEGTPPDGGVITAEGNVTALESVYHSPGNEVDSTNESKVVREEDTADETETAGVPPKTEGALPSLSEMEETLPQSEVRVLKSSTQENDLQTHIPEGTTKLNDQQAKTDDSESLTQGSSNNENERGALQTGLGEEELQVLPEEEPYEKPHQSNLFEHSHLTSVEESIPLTEASRDKGVYPSREAPAISEEGGTVTQEEVPIYTSPSASTEVEEGYSVKEEEVSETTLQSETNKTPVAQENLAMSQNRGPSVVDRDEVQHSTSPLPSANEQVSLETFNKDETGAGEITTELSKEQNLEDDSGISRRRGTRAAMRRPKARRRRGQEQSPPEEEVSPPAIEVCDKDSGDFNVPLTQADITPSATQLSGKESVESTGIHLNPQPTTPSPQPRARSKTPEAPRREDLLTQATSAKEESEMETTSPQPGSRPHVKQRKLPQLPTSKDEATPWKQPDEGEGVVSPPGSPVLRRSSKTVSKASRGTYLSSTRRNQQTDTSVAETDDKSSSDRQVTVDNNGPQEGNPLPAAHELPADRSVIDRVPEVQMVLTKQSDVESVSQLNSKQQAAQKPPRREEASVKEYSLPISETEREDRSKSPLPGLEESIDISNFNLSTPPSEPPPELTESVPSSTLEGEGQQDRSTTMQLHDKEKVQEDEAQIRRGSQVLSKSARPQTPPSRREQQEEKRGEEEAPKVFEEFKAEEGLPRSSRVLSTNEGRPKLNIGRRSKRPVGTQQTDKPVSDHQESQVEPQLSHVVTEAETGQEMKDTNKIDTAIEQKKEQPGKLEGPTVESEGKSIRRSSEVVHRKKSPRVSRLSERKLRLAIPEEEDKTHSNEGEREGEEEDSDSRFRKVRVQVGKYAPRCSTNTPAY